MRITVSKSNEALESTSANSNPYLDADNHLSVTRVMALNDAIAKRVGKDPEAKTTMVYRIPRKAKLAKYSTAQERKGNLKYLSQRAVKVASAKRMSDTSMIKNKPLLKVYDKDVLGDSLYAKVKMAVSAINTHMKRADKTKAAVTKQKGKNREAANKEFELAMTEFQKIISAAGLTPADMAISTGMMGTTALVRVGKDLVVSVGKSDMARFRAAKAAAS